MKLFLTIFCSLFFTILLAQKRYDCILILKHEIGENVTRIKGKLKIVNDSSLAILVNEKMKMIDWNLIQTIRFRKRHGYMRTVIPLCFIASASLVVVVSLYTSITPSHEWVVPFITGVVFVNLLTYIGTPIYFLTRDHNFKISNHQDFLKLQTIASKYIRK